MADLTSPGTFIPLAPSISIFFTPVYKTSPSAKRLVVEQLVNMKNSDSKTIYML